MVSVIQIRNIGGQLGRPGAIGIKNKYIFLPRLKIYMLKKNYNKKKERRV